MSDQISASSIDLGRPANKNAVIPGRSESTSQRGQYSKGMFRSGALAILAAGLLLVGGCSVGEPIVPADTYELVNEQGRERTYDLVWQDIRRFEGALERGEKSNFADQALTILSRINRLAEGKASGMNRDRFWEVLTNAEQETLALSEPARSGLLLDTARALRKAFDTGDFVGAQTHALEALAQARTLGP